MELNHLPVIDWPLAIQLANNKKDLAEELLDVLMKTLPNDIAKIKTCYQEDNHTHLLRQVHRLHGALCYCGLPRLKAVIETLETNLKSNIMESLPSLFAQLDAEFNLLIEYYQETKNQ